MGQERRDGLSFGSREEGDLADLQRDARPALPTFTEYLPRVLAAAGPGALRAYHSCWQRMTTAWGDLAINTVNAGDIQALQRRIAARARARRDHRAAAPAGTADLALPGPPRASERRQATYCDG